MEQEVINFSESEHPRKKDGTFAKKEDIEIDKKYRSVQKQANEKVKTQINKDHKNELPSHAQLRTMPKEELIRKFLIDDGSIDKEDDMRFYKQLHQTELIDRIYKKHQKANNSLYTHTYMEY